MKKLKIMSLLLAAAVLSGCSGINFSGIQDSLVPPNMSEEQTAIYRTLTAADEMIKLKYPSRGDIRNAVIMKDFDKDGVDEAIAFYRSTAVGANPHVFIKVLKGSGKEWTVIADIEGDGNDIDRVAFGNSTENNEMFMVVGYDVANKSERVFRVYSYNDGEMTAEVSMNYSMLEVYDLDEDANDEILYVGSVPRAESVVDEQNLTVQKKNVIYAGMMRRIGGQYINVSKTPMNIKVYDYVKIAKGRINDGRPALYLDGRTDGNVISTEILCENSGRLVNLIYKEKNGGLLSQTEREGIAISDVNGDEVYEIPQTYTIGTSSNGENLPRLTDWFDYENGGLSKIMSSYVNSTDGYIFSFPQKWEYKVGVERNPDTGVTTFFTYNRGGLKGDEILKIKTQKRKSESDKQSGEYSYIKDNGQFSYYAQIPKSAPAEYRLSVKKIKSNLIVKV